MSSTSKRPRATADAAGEVVTNWAVVKIVAGLVVLATVGIVFSGRSSDPAPTGYRRAEIWAEMEAPAVRDEPLEPPEQLTVVERPQPKLAVEAERPPKRSPRSAFPQERMLSPGENPTTAVVNGASPASSREWAASAQSKTPLVTLDERELLRQLGFCRELDAAIDEASASGLVPLSVADSRAHYPHVVDIDLDAEKGTIEELQKMVEKVSPKSPSRILRRSDDASIERQVSPSIVHDVPPAPEWAKDGAPADAWLDLFAKRSDLQGLPLRKGAACRLGESAAASLRTVSRQLGRLAFLSDEEIQDFLGESLRETIVRLIGSPRARRADSGNRAVPGAVQILQVRNVAARQSLVDALASIDSPDSTAALTERALFELSKPVREAAVKAIAQRSAAQVQPPLLAALRYPWAAIADHAAEALVAINDCSAAGELVKLLDKPDPTAPFVSNSGKWAVRELARVNHLRSCLLCHPPSLSSSDPVRGLVPIPGQPLPHNPYDDPGSRGVFVRADVTYLKQDFSLMHPVEKPNRWPKVQRFDYLVRTRELTAAEVAKKGLPNAEVARSKPSPDEQDYPQREAVIYALRRLTGLDGGKSARHWRALVH